MGKKLKKIITSVLISDKNIDIAYLFGSAAKNYQRFGSDIDIAIYFRNSPDLDQIGKLILRLEEASGLKVDLIQLNNLDKANPVMAYAVISEGIILVNNNPGLLNEYKTSVILQYLDFKPTSDYTDEKFSYRLLNNKFAFFDKLKPTS
jgi:predicted nucleotidyltransferase